MTDLWLIDETRPLSPRDEEEASLVRHGFDAGAPVAPLAVALHDVVVYSTTRLLGAADIRLDAVAVTIPAPGEASELYQPRTFTFPDVRGGDRLPIETNLLLYLGRPHAFLDLSIMASPAKAGDPDLAELLAANAVGVGDAAAALTTIALASPQAMAIGAAATAAATLASVALRLVQAHSGKTIGLYRQTWYEHRDGFGLGRHPDGNEPYRAREFSFWYEIFRDAPVDP